MIAIHTDAEIGSQPLAGLWNVIPGEVAGGRGPDCIYGWGEAQDRPECRPHTLVMVDDINVAAAVLRILVAHGSQAVATDADDFSHVLNLGASYYTDDHQH